MMCVLKWNTATGVPETVKQAHNSCSQSLSLFTGHLTVLQNTAQLAAQLAATQRFSSSGQLDPLTDQRKTSVYDLGDEVQISVFQKQSGWQQH